MTCPVCESPVPPNRRVLCSEACAKTRRDQLSAEWRRKWRDASKPCVICGNLFAAIGNHKTCGDEECVAKLRVRQAVAKKKYARKVRVRR